jgi:hypothetical protein
MIEISGEEARELGLQIINPHYEEVGFLLPKGAETNHPDWKYQDRGNIYFLDDVFTGENCKTPVKTSNLWINQG